ncbi:MAG: hypothetical protein IKY67_05770 [Paludibacteraceae bacterium]|nr:hypothetical protein [Paludibacteraceae bacterium]
MEHSEYLKLQDQLQDHFDGRYRKIKDCDEIVEPIAKHNGESDTRLAVIEQQNKLMLWILAAVSGGIITMLIKMFFGA